MPTNKAIPFEPPLLVLRTQYYHPFRSAIKYLPLCQPSSLHLISYVASLRVQRSTMSQVLTTLDVDKEALQSVIHYVRLELNRFIGYENSTTSSYQTTIFRRLEGLYSDFGTLLGQLRAHGVRFGYLNTQKRVIDAISTNDDLTNELKAVGIKKILTDAGTMDYAYVRDYSRFSEDISLVIVGLQDLHEVLKAHCPSIQTDPITPNPINVGKSVSFGVDDNGHLRLPSQREPVKPYEGSLMGNEVGFNEVGKVPPSRNHALTLGEQEDAAMQAATRASMVTFEEEQAAQQIGASSNNETPSRPPVGLLLVPVTNVNSCAGFTAGQIILKTRDDVFTLVEIAKELYEQAGKDGQMAAEIKGVKEMWDDHVSMLEVLDMEEDGEVTPRPT